MASQVSSGKLGHRIDINKANLPVLEEMFHDRERANQILNTRELRGDFESWDDLKERLPGIDDDLITQWRAAGLVIGARESRREEARAAGATTPHRVARSRQ